MSLFRPTFTTVLGMDSLGSGRLSTHWDQKLEGLLRATLDRPAKVISAGRGSQTSAWGVTQIEYWRGFRPSAFILSLTMNDAVDPPVGEMGLSLAQHDANYVQIINGMRANNPDVHILIATMNPVSATVGAGRPNLDGFWQRDREIAAREGCHLVDINPLWKAAAGGVQYLPQTSEWFLAADGLHPADQKVEQIALPAFFNALAPLAA